MQAIVDNIEGSKQAGFSCHYADKINDPEIIRRLENQGYTLDVSANKFDIIKWGKMKTETTKVIIIKNQKEHHYPIVKAIPEPRVKGIWKKFKRFLFYRRYFQIQEDFAYYSSLLNAWLFLPEGFIFSGENLPKSLYILMGSTGPLLLGAALHDFGYSYQGFASLPCSDHELENINLIQPGINFNREQKAIIDKQIIAICKESLEKQTTSWCAEFFADFLRVLFYFSRKKPRYNSGISVFHRDFPFYKIMNAQGDL